MARKAQVARLARDEDDVRTVSHAAQIVGRYRSQGLSGKRLAARVVRHARTLSGLDTAVAVELLIRARDIEWEAKQAC